MECVPAASEVLANAVPTVRERLSKPTWLIGTGLPVGPLALAWCVRNPRVSTVITGATRVEQITENMKALDVVPRLVPDVLARIDGIVNPAAPAAS